MADHPHTAKVMAPLAAAVRFVDHEAEQSPVVVCALESRHQQLALDDLFWRHQQDLELALRVAQLVVDRSCVGT